MKKTVLLKRILFWLESSASIVIILLGGAIVLWLSITTLFADDPGALAREIGEIAAYFIKPVIRLVTEEPLLLITTIFWVAVYIATMVYFAQTDGEKKLSKYVIALTLISLPVCAIAGFSTVIAGLASQGAGH